jgi:ParB-like chromosome segregation protein Spo0J
MTNKAKLTWTTKKVKLEELKGLPRNPRKISGKAIDALVSDITELGHFRPLVVDYDYTILGGNQREKALKKLNEEIVEVSYPNRLLSEREKQKIVLLDNLHRGEFEMNLLLEDFDHDLLGELDFSLPSIESPKDLSDQFKTRYLVEVEVASENEQQKLFNELTGKNYKCKVLTL